MEYSIAYRGPANTTLMPRFQGFADTTVETDDTEESDVPLTDMKGKTPVRLPEKGFDTGTQVWSYDFFNAL